MAKSVPTIPYEFVFDYLPAGITSKKMFGMHYIYWGKKLMLMLRKRDNEPEMNGIWVATNTKYHESLKKDVAVFVPFKMDGYEHEGNWLLIPDNAEELEEAAIRVCEMISHGDPRIGNLTKKPPL